MALFEYPTLVYISYIFTNPELVNLLKHIMTQKVGELLDLSRERVTSVFANGDAPVIDHVLDADEEVLVALGYRQEFKRKFNIWSSFSVSFSVLGLLPSVAATLGFSLGYLHSIDFP